MPALTYTSKPLNVGATIARWCRCMHIEASSIFQSTSSHIHFTSHTTTVHSHHNGTGSCFFVFLFRNQEAAEATLGDIGKYWIQLISGFIMIQYAFSSHQLIFSPHSLTAITARSFTGEASFCLGGSKPREAPEARHCFLWILRSSRRCWDPRRAKVAPIKLRFIRSTIRSST